MASQRVTIAKIGGAVSDLVLARLTAWSNDRRSGDPDEWSSDQWPLETRREVNAFAKTLRRHALQPPVMLFVEWADLWSMGDVFPRALESAGGRAPIQICADRFEVYGYSLDDEGRLGRALTRTKRLRFPEYQWLARRLQEAVAAWSACRTGP